MTSIDTVGTKASGTTNFSVSLTLTDVSPLVRPNMTATATITTLKKEGILTIPNSAIIDKNGQAYVQKSGASNGNLTKIELGSKGLINTEVVSGLVAGDKILIPD